MLKQILEVNARIAQPSNGEYRLTSRATKPATVFSRRTLLAVAACAALRTVLAPSGALAEDLTTEAAGFVARVIARAFEILQKKSLRSDERIKALTALFLENFDVRAMSLFALGTYAGRAMGPQRDAYVDAFKDYMIHHYFGRLEAIGDTFSIGRASPDGENVVWVTSGVGSRDGKPYRVEWRVRKTDGTLKIFDVILEGSSLLWVQRSDFASVLQRNNGNITQLTELMRVEKVGKDTP
ncbi:MAG: phospholipid-binding protein MlaC [Alphaproteobacteria bacterium]